MNGNETEEELYSAALPHVLQQQVASDFAASGGATSDFAASGSVTSDFAASGSATSDFAAAVPQMWRRGHCTTIFRPFHNPDVPTP
jgi:hypothetical protein